jgi:CubicO group peptidase (beta-lactamase class C family)
MAGGAMNARLIAINEPIAWSSPPMPRLNRIHLPAVVRRIPRKATVLAIAAAFVAVNAAVPAASQTVTEPMAPAALDDWFDGVVQDAGIPGAAIVVVRDGQIVHEHGVGIADDSGRPVTGQTPFVIGSLAKSLTALAVVQLADRGRLDLDAPVRRYLPDFAVADPPAGRMITIRQLLNQTSGLPGAAGTAPLSAPATTLADQVRALGSVRLASAPGAAYQYSNANYVVLGRVIEVVSAQSYEAYMQAHVFRPLAMSHTSSDLATAQADGLGRAHRLWFGLPDSHQPLFREDLAPAGFIASSAEDLGHVLVAEVNGGRFGTTSVASPNAIAQLWAGTAAAGPAGRYAMGWFDGTFDGERIIAHAGSSTDMASYQAVIPSRGLGVVVLFNAQSVMYELLHKPDSIGQAAVARLIGHEGPGTLALFYPAFDLLALLVLATLSRNLIRLVQSSLVPRSRPWPTTWRARGMLAVRLYLDLVVPSAILTRAPELLGAGWLVLVRTDLGLVLAVIALMRLLDGAVRGLRTVRALRLSDPAASLMPSPAGSGLATPRGG